MTWQVRGWRRDEEHWTVCETQREAAVIARQFRTIGLGFISVWQSRPSVGWTLAGQDFGSPTGQLVWEGWLDGDDGTFDC